ncbi:CPBP family intramembrane glutamic endopeptidase [uncultured Corynebacterium sp.]|uniref:CPBP family intramembrane glutamic endopeptidase n=1 Tax=uncultured Corynebacterium sp. TaxID=159447 RepID=UPI002599EDCE|nr:CPBP family intramembrane glutamic endopeptidase [uncultured Corynebacterium sp.]
MESSPRIPVNAWGLLLRAIVAAAVLLGANSARLPIHKAAGSDSLLVQAAIFCFTPVLVAAFVVVWVRRVERTKINWAGARGIVGGTAIAVVPLAAAWLLLGATSGPAEALPQGVGEAEAQAPVATLLIWVLVRSYLLQGIPEELVYRGWLFDVTRPRPVLTVAWTTAAFTLAHVWSSGGQRTALDHLVYLAVPFGMSLLAAGVVYTFGSFWWAAGTHGGMHLTIALLTAVYPIELGARAWVILGAAQAVLGVALLWRRKAGARN